MIGRAAACAAVAIATLPGCVLTRILDTRAQMCDEQPARVKVSRKPGSDLRVHFEVPTLTDRDVAWIVGSKPSAVRESDALRELSYEAVPMSRPLDRSAGLVSRASFVRVGGEYRLSQVEIPAKFGAILPPALIDASLKVLCKPKIGLVPPGTTFDLAEVDRETLPGREALVRLLGPPDSASPKGDAISYQYCLAPCEAPASRVAALAFRFDARGAITFAEATYFRYFAVLDLASATPTATLTLHDGDGEIRLGLDPPDRAR